MGAVPKVSTPDAHLTGLYSELYEKAYGPFYGQVADLDEVREEIYGKHEGEKQ